MSSDALHRLVPAIAEHPPRPLPNARQPAHKAAGRSPASYAARRRRGEHLLGVGGTALLYALMAATVLSRWAPPHIAPSSRPAPALAVFDIPPASPPAASHSTPSPSQKAAHMQPPPHPAEAPRPIPPVPIVRSPTPITVQAEPPASTRPSEAQQTNRPDDAAAPARAAPAAALPTSGRTASAERAARTNWQGDILAHLRPLRRYPRMAERDGQQGVAIVAIGVDRQGAVRSARIVHGSGYPLLDGEALATVKRGSPLPPPTADIPGDPVSVELPIQFNLRG